MSIQKLIETNTGQTKKRAFLVSSFKSAKERTACQNHLEELANLAKTIDLEPSAYFPCSLRQINAKTFFSKGKLEEMVASMHSGQFDLVLIDEEITPAQKRSLETLFSLPVMDRAEVILAVFAKRAKTKEAKLQIELAQAEYEAPRLKRLWTHLSRQAGSGGGKYLKGEGEKQIEIDRRILKDKITKLKEELAEVRKQRILKRQMRIKNECPTFAIIGYTNAGKSSLMNALTGAGLFVEDKLFATLDTATRKWTLRNNQDILLIDTVGFIRKLPHLLIEAFMSTLEEVNTADFFLHVIDASDPLCMEHFHTTTEVLKQLGQENKKTIHLLNKCDKEESKKNLLPLRITLPKTIVFSVHEQRGFEELYEAIEEAISDLVSTLKLQIPQKEYGLIAEITREGEILYQEYEGNDVIIRAKVPKLLVPKLKPYVF